MLIEFLQLSGQQIYTVSCTVCYRNKNDPISFNRGNNTPEKNIFRPKGRCKWHFFLNLNVGYKQKPKKETPEGFPSTVINFSKIFTNYIFHPPQPPWPVHRWCLISDTNNTPDLGHTMTGGAAAIHLTFAFVQASSHLQFLVPKQEENLLNIFTI